MRGVLILLTCTLLAGCPREGVDASKVAATPALEPAAAGSLATPATSRMNVANALGAAQFVRNDTNGNGRSVLQVVSYLENGVIWTLTHNQVGQQDPVYGATNCFLNRRQVAIADFNGDLVGDFLHVGTDDRSVCISLGERRAFGASIGSFALVATHTPGWMPVAAQDADGDGKSDIVLVNPSARLMAYWRLDGLNIVGYSPVFAWPEQATGFGAPGDFDGDGRFDIAWDDGTLWTGVAGGFVSQRPAGLKPPAGWLVNDTGDVDGDGRRDLLLFNARSNHFAYWLMDGTGVRQKSIAFAAPAGYRLTTYGDYNGDGKLDLLWVEKLWANTNRTILMWTGNGFGFTASMLQRNGQNYGVGACCRLVGIPPPRYVRGDVLGDGRSDLLLVNEQFAAWSYWTMDGPTASPARFLPFQTLGRLAATGDFDGDGRMELVWVRESDGLIRMSFFDDSGQVETRTSVNVNVAAGWSVRTATDVDADGRDDLVLYNESQQRSAYWLMDGAQVVFYSEPEGSSPIIGPATSSNDGTEGVFKVAPGGVVLYTKVRYNAFGQSHTVGTLANGWRAVGAADIDGNGQSDLVVENDEGIAYWIVAAGGGVIHYSPGFLRPAGYRLASIGDYTGDSRADVVWARESDGSLLLWRGNAGGGFDAELINVAFRPGYRVVQP